MSRTIQKSKPKLSIIAPDEAQVSRQTTIVDSVYPFSVFIRTAGGKKRLNADVIIRSITDCDGNEELYLYEFFADFEAVLGGEPKRQSASPSAYEFELRSQLVEWAKSNKILLSDHWLGYDD